MFMKFRLNICRVSKFILQIFLFIGGIEDESNR